MWATCPLDSGNCRYLLQFQWRQFDRQRAEALRAYKEQQAADSGDEAVISDNAKDANSD